MILPERVFGRPGTICTEEGVEHALVLGGRRTQVGSGLEGVVVRVVNAPSAARVHVCMYQEFLRHSNGPNLFPDELHKVVHHSLTRVTAVILQDHISVNCWRGKQREQCTALVPTAGRVLGTTYPAQTQHGCSQPQPSQPLGDRHSAPQGRSGEHNQVTSTRCPV